MRRRASLFLILLAVGAVCFLLWESVLGPALLDEGADDELSMLDAEAALDGGGGTATQDAPGLSGLGATPGAGGRGPDGGGALADGLTAAERAARAGAASVPFEGRVVGPNGAPAKGVKIVLKGPGGVETIETDANGAFKHSLRPGRYGLMFQGEDGGLMLRNWMLDGSPKEELEFALKEPAAVAVLISRGKDPVADADVVLTSREMGELATFTLATDGLGQALFENLVPGRYDIVAQVPEGPLAKANAFAPPGNKRDVKVKVPDGIVFKGLVRAGKSGPGVAARLTLETQAAGSQGVFETVFETRPDGTYELTVPKGWARNFVVEADGHAPWPNAQERRNVLRSLRGLSRKGPVTRNVILRGGAQLSGIVTTEDKTPVPGLKLRFAMRRGPVVSVTTTDGGAYAVANLNPGRYYLQVETPAWFPIRGQVMDFTVPGGASPKPVTFDISLLGARRLEGIIVDAAGQGLGGARVWIVGGGRVVRGARNAGRVLEVFSGKDGRWVITDIPPDKTVIVRAAMGQLEADPVSARWEKPPPGLIRMTLKGTSGLRGTVVDLATRRGLARARVRIVPDPYDGRTGRTVYTNNNGEFSVENMLPGRWKLTPWIKSYLPAEAESVDLVREGESEVTLRLDPGQVFAGVVQTESGVPLRNTRVRVRGRPNGAKNDVTRTATTNTKGAFRLTGFAQGTYEVSFRRNGYRTVTRKGFRDGDDRLHIVLRPH